MKILWHTLVAAAIFVAAQPVMGQVLLLDLNTSVPMAATLDNPCTAEPEAILFQGTTALQQRVWLLANGNLRLQFAENTALEGTTGLLGGTKYVVSGGSDKDLEFDPVGFSVLQFKKVTQDAVTDNFHSVLVLTFDPQNLKLDLKLEGACDNGMP
jgi:hypothetical protein